MVRWRLTKKQANRLMQVSRYGKTCQEKRFDPELIKRFLKERRLSLISDKLPNASKGIAKKLSPSTKLGLKDPVLDYFFGVHNKKILLTGDKLKRMRPLKRTAYDIIRLRKCMVDVGIVKKIEGKKLVVELPNKERIIVDSEIGAVGRDTYVLTHDGHVVDTVQSHEYNKYSEFYKKSAKKR